MVLSLGEEASKRLAKARAAADRSYHRNKDEIPSTWSIYRWEEAVRDLCAYYTLDIVIAEAKELAASDYPILEIQSHLEHRVEELAQSVVDSAKWPVETNLGAKLRRTLRQTHLRRHIDFIKCSPQWIRLQKRLFGKGISVGIGGQSERKATEPARDRRKAVDAYIEEVSKIRKRITRTDIWKHARYKSRTEFERWESYWYEKHEKRPNKSANEKFTRILTEKPHLK